MSQSLPNTTSATWRVLQGLETPEHVAEIICAVISKSGVDRLEFLASISDKGWEKMINEHNQSPQANTSRDSLSGAQTTGAASAESNSTENAEGTAAAGAGDAVAAIEDASQPQMSEAQVEVVIACARAATTEARRLLDCGQKAVDAALPSLNYQASLDSLVKRLSDKMGVIPANLIPDEKVMRVLMKSSSAFVDFKLLNSSDSGSTTRKRLRTTTSGLLVEVYEDVDESHGPEGGAVLDVMASWTSQFSRYIIGIALVDEEAARNVFTFLSYQCDIGRIGLYSPSRAIEADKQFRLSVPGMAATGVPVYQCFMQQHTSPFFSRLLAEMANRRMWHFPRHQKGGKGKGNGKGKGKGQSQWWNSPSGGTGGHSSKGGAVREGASTTPSRNPPSRQ